MQKKIDTYLNLIDIKDIELFSLITLMLWAISPIIEYIFRNYYVNYYTLYFNAMTHLIGVLGLLTYGIYLIKLNSEKKISIKQFIPEILILILTIISIISSFISKDPHLSFFGERYRKEGLFIYIMYVGFLLLSSTIKNDKYIKYLIKSMIASCLIITILPLFKNDFTYTSFTNIFHNSNHYGYYLMINVILTLGMFIHDNKIIKKIIYALIYTFFLYLLIRNNTFGSYLAIIITLVFLFIYSIIKKYKRLNIILVIIIFIITSFAVSTFDIKIGERINFQNTKGIVSKNMNTLGKDINAYISNDENGIMEAGTHRGLLWEEAGKYIIKHPVFGGGMECLKEYYRNDSKTNGSYYSDRPHNMILQVAAFIGIPGAIIYLGLILYIAISNLIIMKDNTIHIMIYTSAMCYFISSMFGNSMYYTSPYFMIFLGLLIGFKRFNQRLTQS